jgi:hypothetical protein
MSITQEHKCSWDDLNAHISANQKQSCNIRTGTCKMAVQMVQRVVSIFQLHVFRKKNMLNIIIYVRE